MLNRRQFHLSLGGVCSKTATDEGLSSPYVTGQQKQAKWCLADEAAKHRRTWLAFVAKPEIWGRRHALALQNTLGELARRLVQYEPVTVLVNPEDRELARRKCGPDVEILSVQLDDLWLRDSGAVFVQHPVVHTPGAIGFNFNGWGNKQAHENDSRVARIMGAHAGYQYIEASIVLEGGALEVDGEGTAIITESAVLNGNRNPGVSKAQMEDQLARLLGIEKVIWLPGIKGMDITDAHTDFYARFTRPGRVLAHIVHDESNYEYELTRLHKEILQGATDAKGRHLMLTTVEAPDDLRDDFFSEDFAAGYLNYYVANGVVVVPQFGDTETDRRACQILQAEYPGRVIETLDIDPVAAAGGGIHCMTMHEPGPG